MKDKKSTLVQSCDVDLKSVDKVFQLPEFTSFDESHFLQLWNSIKGRDTKDDES